MADKSSSSLEFVKYLGLPCPGCSFRTTKVTTFAHFSVLIVTSFTWYQYQTKMMTDMVRAIIWKPHVVLWPKRLDVLLYIQPKADYGGLWPADIDSPSRPRSIDSLASNLGNLEKENDATKQLSSSEEDWTSLLYFYRILPYTVIVKCQGLPLSVQDIISTARQSVRVPVQCTVYTVQQELELTRGLESCAGETLIG